MVCHKCGAELKEGAMFCGQCGANQMEVFADQAEVLEQEVAMVPEEVTPEEAPQTEEIFGVEEPVLKKKKGSKQKLIAIIAAAVAVLGVLVFVFWGQIKNAFVSMMPAEKQLQYAYKNSAEKWSEGTGEWITEFKKANVKNGGSAKGELAVQVDEDILTQLIGMELDGLNKVSLDYAYSANKDDSMVQLILKLADKQIVTANGILDLDEGKMVVQVPELSDQALETEFDTEMYNESINESYQMIEQIQDMMPSGDYAERILPKYVEVLAGAIEKADRSKTTLEVGNVSQKVTVIKTKIDASVIGRMGDALLSELKNDKDFKKSMQDIYNGAEELSGEDLGSFDEFYDEFFEGLKDVFAELEDTEFVQEGFELVTWINANNEVVGIQVDEYLRIAKAQNKEKVAYEFCATEDGEELAKMLVVGTQKNDVFKGNIEIYAEEEKVLTVNVDKYISTKNEFACAASVDVPDEFVSEIVGSSIPGKVSVNFEIALRKGYEDLKLNLSWGGKEIVGIAFSAETPKEALKLEYPSDVTNNPMTWSMGLNPQKLMESLEKAGLSQDVLSTLIQSIGATMY